MSLLVSIDGQPIPGIIKAEVTSTNYFCSDSFSLVFAAGPPPLVDIDTWSNLATGTVELSQSTSPGVAPAFIMTGQVDTIVADVGFQNVVLEGRDLSARLVDSYVQQDFVNQTASEVVTTIGSQYNLNCEVTPTLGNVGRYFGDGYTRLSLGDFSRIRSNWDLIVELAREDNFDVFVSGSTLFYQPVIGTLESALELTRSDVSVLRLTRRMTSGFNISVRVQSWNSQQESAYNSTGMLDGAQLTSVAPASQGYLFSSSNLTSAQADAYAQRYAREVSRLQTTLHIVMPGIPILFPRTLICLVGCGSSIDGLYQVDAVERHFCAISGTSQTIRAVSWPVL